MSDHSESFRRPARPVVALSTTTMPSVARPISAYPSSATQWHTGTCPLRVDFGIMGRTVFGYARVGLGAPHRSRDRAAHEGGWREP
jgi:hypothetical protein